MLKYSIREKGILLVVMAVFLLLIFPLLQLVHLSSCSCGQTHSACFHDNTSNKQSILDINRDLESHLNSKSRHSENKHSHDSESCPVCNLYSSVQAGCSLPVKQIFVLQEVIVEQPCEAYSNVYLVQITHEFSPRAPPVI